MIFKWVNKQLLPMKAHYFLWNAGTGPIVPFLSLYANQLGYSGFVVGLVYTVLNIVVMLSRPIFGAIADRFKCQKKLFLASIILSAAAFLAVYYSPEAPIERQVHFACTHSEAVFNTYPGALNLQKNTLEKIKSLNSTNCQLTCKLNPSYLETLCEEWSWSQYCNVTSQTHFSFSSEIPLDLTDQFNNILIFRILELEPHKIKPICTKQIQTQCDITCKGYLNSLLKKQAVEDAEVASLYQFWIFLLMMIFAWIGQSVSVSVGDAICFQMLGDQPQRYGNQRLFGALGWGIFSAVAGFMIDSLSEGGERNYISVFYLGFAFLLLDCLVCTQLKFKQENMSLNLFKDLGKLLSNFRIIVFLLWCISVGMCTGLMWNFLLWHVEELAKNQSSESEKWIKTLEGLLMATQCLLGELPFFFLSGYILKRVGHVNTMSLVLAVLGVRLILYSVIENPWWFLPVELLNGLTFGLFYACMASYASIVAPKGTETTMQGLVGAIFEGVGVALGSLTAGNLMDQYGGALTFRFFGIGTLIACLVHAAIQYLIRNKGSEYTLTETYEEDEREFFAISSSRVV